MDKVRSFLKIAWVQRFWILCVVGALAAVSCWFVASGKLQAEFTANKAAIDGKFGEMSAIAAKQVHGNPGVNAKEREEAKLIADSVRSLWQNLYDVQREQVLYWPEVLGPDFLREIDKKKFDSSISTGMRDRYHNYIKNRFDALVEIVDAKKMATPDGAFGGPISRDGGRFGGEMTRDMGASGMIGPDGMPIEEDYLVEWLDQGNVQQQLEFAQLPTARQIWVTQEDLWVYETLLRVINNTNQERGATRPDNTAIRVIQSLEVGQPAALAMSQEAMILLPADVNSTMGGEQDMSMESMRGGMDPYGRGMTEGEDPGAMLLMQRYIDAEGQAIPDASTGIEGEFRRLPIRMVLLMDERWIPRILVECANAPLPIEVQRLQVNLDKSGVDKDNQAFELSGVGDGAFSGSGSGMMRGGEMAGRMPMGRGGEMGGRMPMGRGGEMGGRMPMGFGNAADVADLATVEIQGLVYIFNAPDPAVLSVPGDEQSLAAGDAAVVR